MTKVSSNTVKVTLIVTLIILSGVIGSIFIYKTNTENTQENLVNNLYIIGKEGQRDVNLWIKNIIYEVKLYSQLQEFKSMDIDKIITLSEFIRSYKQEYKSIILINNENKIIYGYVENMERLIEEDYIKQATQGEIGVSNLITVEDKIYIDIASPITEKNEQIGVLCIRIALDELNNIMNKMMISNDTESYIVDSNGTLITESRFIPDATGNIKVDIDKVKLAINYSKNIPYKDYRGINVYGNYFSIDYGELTLLVEKDAEGTFDKDVNLRRLIEGVTAIQVIIITLIQQIFKKRSKKNLIDDDIIDVLYKYNSGTISKEEMEEVIKKLM